MNSHSDASHENLLKLVSKHQAERDDLRTENDIYRIQNEDYRKENEDYRREIAELSCSLKNLRQEVEWFRRQVFGKKSEKIKEEPSNPKEIQLYFPGFEPENYPEDGNKEEKEEVAAHKRRKRRKTQEHEITFPDDLPEEITVLDLPEEEKVCPDTGEQLIKIGEEVTRKLAFRPGSYYIKVIIRPKYANPKKAEEGICLRELPETFFPKCRADESFVAEVLTKKFADHMPLYRISEMLGREEIKVTRQLLSQWVLKAGEVLKPLHDLTKKRLLESGYIHMDESPVKMLLKGNGKAHTGYMWVMVGGKGEIPPYRVYEFRLNRKHEHAFELLEGFAGKLHADKYSAYVKIAEMVDRITFCSCWAHVRRKFFEAEYGDKDFRKWILRQIRYLYMLERIAWKRSPDERTQIREKYEVPIIDEVIKRVREKVESNRGLPKSKYGRALKYCHGLIPYLKNYTKDPWCRIDNNVAERAVRPLAIGRKNWLFVGSERGGKAAATLLSLIQTCRELKINPREYIEDVLKRIQAHNFSKLHELLPHEWIEHRTQ